MKKKKIVIILFVMLLLLSGCWDQRLLKNGRLVFSSAFDLTSEGDIHATSIIRDFRNGAPINTEVEANGRTIREIRMHLDRKISGNFEPSKNRVYLLGEDLARKDIYDFLDIFYRDPNSSISSKLAITEGEAGETLDTIEQKNILISEYIIESITSGESYTGIPKVNLQSVCTIMFDEGKDFFVPLIKYDNDEVVLSGTALFHKKAMVGKLSIPESTLVLVLMNKKRKIARFVTKVDKGRKVNIENYITYNLVNPKTKMKIVSSTPGNIQVELTLKTGATIVEFPQDELADKTKLKELDKKISKHLTKEAVEVIKKIQEANSDLFGIGRELIAFHHKDWEQIDWDQEYPTITIKPKIEVEIVGNGIIN
ncbi:Ger(x)C family spore germination protein [Rossellomorea arthrocnemi]|uniref:Ger(x)C family spore germination protein n=1 Tax=Rossellomorea arthrocnemi TaxID=2769542 RepID=UPI001919D25C|nr:Ger(x)C family spore germination protein [Rossellomorea arthrocnemi]